MPQLTARGARIVGISTDPAPESRMLRRALKLEFPLLHDDDAEVAAAYGVRMAADTLAIPSVFVVAPDQTILWRHIGEYVPDRPTPQAVLAAIDRNPR